MFGRILFISDNMAEVENVSKGNISADLMNVHVIFETGDQRILGEVTEINDEIIKIRFLGEYLNGRYVNGIMRKPLLSSKIRIINSLYEYRLLDYCLIIYIFYRKNIIYIKSIREKNIGQ